jgi:endonuclease-3
VKSTSEFAREVRKRLHEHYGAPSWRNPLPAIDELVSTILSQNTNDTNRDRAFEALTERFPSWEAVRDADPEQVIDAIRSAGLANQKGPRIQRILRQISEEQGSLNLDYLRDLPADEAREELLRFKGVGPKTAAIVLLFSLDKPDFPVDTHIYRVTGRLGLRSEGMTAEAAHQHLATIFPPESYAEVHLNLIRHGREICHARNPQCALCFLSDLCAYYAHTVRDQSGIAS